MQINRKTIGASSAVRLFAGDIWLNLVALGSSSHTIRTSENLRELFNRFEIDKKQTFENSGGIPDSGFSSLPATPAKKVCRVVNHHLSTSTTTYSKYQENSGSIKKLLNSPIFCTDADTKKSLIWVQRKPDFWNLQVKRKLVRKIGQLEKSGVKLQCSTGEGTTFGSTIGKKLRIREIGIPLFN